MGNQPVINNSSQHPHPQDFWGILWLHISHIAQTCLAVPEKLFLSTERSEFNSKDSQGDVITMRLMT